MTEFQRWCRRNPGLLAESGLFNKFLEFYPNLQRKEAKKEFSKQVDELFFGKVEKDYTQK